MYIDIICDWDVTSAVNVVRNGGGIVANMPTVKREFYLFPRRMQASLKLPRANIDSYTVILQCQLLTVRSL